MLDDKRSDNPQELQITLDDLLSMTILRHRTNRTLHCRKID